MIEVRNLCKRFGSINAVNNINFRIPPGTCFGLLGRNGAGKTTTIEMMEGIKTPDSGDILYKGKPPGDAFKHEAGIMFQNTSLQDFVTVKETLTMFSRFYSNTQNMDELIERCELSAFLKQDVKKISGGQRQRLLIAIALINNPHILFLDEPSTGMDPKARRNIWGIVNDIKKEGRTIVLTTHYMEEAYELSDEIIIMDQGDIIAKGSPNDLLSEHYADTVLELPQRDWKENVDVETVKYKDLVRVYSQDIDHTIHRLINGGVSLKNLRIRSRNLEDLFLDLTGEEAHV